jgi:hypothetical protein
VLQRVKEEKNILHTVKRKKAEWTGNILRRNCFLTQDGRDGRRGGKCKQLLEDFKEKLNILYIVRGSTRSYSLENSLWERLWT